MQILPRPRCDHCIGNRLSVFIIFAVRFDSRPSPYKSVDPISPEVWLHLSGGGAVPLARRVGHLRAAQVDPPGEPHADAAVQPAAQGTDSSDSASSLQMWPSQLLLIVNCKKYNCWYFSGMAECGKSGRSRMHPSRSSDCQNCEVEKARIWRLGKIRSRLLKMAKSMDRMLKKCFQCKINTF